MRKRWVAAGCAAAVVLGLFLNNSSTLAAQPNGRADVLAHWGHPSDLLKQGADSRELHCEQDRPSEESLSREHDPIDAGQPVCWRDGAGTGHPSDH